MHIAEDHLAFLSMVFLTGLNQESGLHKSLESEHGHEEMSREDVALAGLCGPRQDM